MTSPRSSRLSRTTRSASGWPRCARDPRETAPSEPSDEELHHEEAERRRELRRAREKADAAHLQEVLTESLPEVFAAVREVSWRKLGMRPFDVQLMGAVALHLGKISEMKTGEGKTLVGPIAAALNAMSGRGVHVVTVNDYLAKRDPQWMGPIFHGLGLTLGAIQHDSAFLFDPDHRGTDERLMYLRPVERREAYAADVVYGTNNEFGFDYLRDNMVVELDQRVQRDRFFAIVDEVDNILIDEARTPLIISGQAEESEDLYYQFARLVPRLGERPADAEEGGDFFVDLKEHAVSPTEEGIDKIEKLLRSRTCSTRIRASRATSSRPCAPTRCTSATATTSSRTARSSSSTNSRAGRCPAADGPRAFTRRSRRRRACASSGSR
jgi:preprotein translocase subunit SecA